MAWTHTIVPGEAAGLLKRIYDEALARAGKVFHIVRLQGLRPEVLQAGLALRAAGFGDPAILEIVPVVGFFSHYNRLA